MIAKRTNAITKKAPYRICFVCLGNICRSPTAEGIFQTLITDRKLTDYFDVDSAGTSAYHIGEPANIHSQRIANTHNVQLQSRARQFTAADLDQFDLILAMDNQNLADIRQLKTADDYAQKVMPLRAFDPTPGDKQVPDPYDGGREGFENVFKVVKRSCKNLLDTLETQIER